jgi:3'-phosphoadenosine 5'-phosphosulfate sulfotransferase (PAPS reductase)/FAD synthetase
MSLEQADLFDWQPIQAPTPKGYANGPDLSSYDHFIVAFSGGKDSLACLLHLMDAGVDRNKIEIWHHSVDGHEGSTLMDWPCTQMYCYAVAEHLRMQRRFYCSWRVGGFEGEMLRQDSPTGEIGFEHPAIASKSPTGSSSWSLVGGKGPKGTRRKFPQLSASLSTRWCSAYLKIDVAARAITNQERFLGKRTLVITGERAQESSSRAKYGQFEPHRTMTQSRHVDQWRPIHPWSEEQVWSLIRQHGIVPHPAYYLGFGRVSCMKCIFGDKDQWATVRELDPEGFASVANYEADFGITIRRDMSIIEAANRGTPYEMQEPWRSHAMTPPDRVYKGPIHINPADWQLPSGAYKKDGGPT